MFTKISERVVSKKDIIVPLLTRYSLYSVALIESFFLPKLIDTYNYSQFEYYKNFIFLFPNFLLGSYSGYVYLKYVNKVDYYKPLIHLGTLISFFLAFISIFIFQNIYLFIPLLFFNIYTLIEQKLKIDRKFTPIFAFKPILSSLSILLAFLFYINNSKSYNYNWALLIIFGLGFILWITIFKVKYIIFPLKVTLNKISILRYVLMVKVILTGVLASLLFGLMIFFERYFIKEYYSDYLPTYSMAFNLSQIIAVLLSAVSYISSVELGENLLKINRSKLLKNFKNAFFLFLIFLGLFMGFVYLINPYYSKFEDLKLITFIISYSKGFFFLTSTISHLAVYHNYNNKMFFFLLKLFIINIASVYILIFLNTNVISLLLLDSIFILIYSLFILNIIFNKIKYSNSVLSNIH